MKRKDYLQQQRQSLLAQLDKIEKELINGTEAELSAEMDPDSDDSEFVETLRRSGKLTDKSNLI